MFPNCFPVEKAVFKRLDRPTRHPLRKTLCFVLFLGFVVFLIYGQAHLLENTCVCSFAFNEEFFKEKLKYYFYLFLVLLFFFASVYENVHLEQGLI